jgi:hypothetical protein
MLGCPLTSFIVDIFLAFWQFDIIIYHLNDLVFETEPCCVAQVGFGFTLLLPQPFKWWDSMILIQQNSCKF